MRGLAIALLAGVLAGPAAAAFPGKNGQLVFAHESESSPGLYLVNPDGTGRKRIYATPDPNVVIPRWSPDGAHIAFQMSPGPSFLDTIHVIAPDGTGDRVAATSVPLGTKMVQPAWLPDGQLSWIRWSALSCSYVEGAATDWWCAPFGQVCNFGQWSSTGVFACALNPPGVFLSDQIDVIDSTGAHRITTTESGATFDWSPDGTKICFTTATNKLAIVNADGTGEHVLAVAGTMPAWSPDGTKIAFASTSGISIVDADGSHLVHVTNDKDDAFPNWRPAATAYQPPAAPKPQAKPKPKKKKKP